jgi:hypothetical protein
VSRRSGAAPAALVSAALVVAAACSSGGGGADDDGATLGSTAAPTEITAPDVPSESPSGTGVVVVGRGTSSFAVTGCQLESEAATDGTTTLVLVTGEGTTAGGIPFEVQVQRTSTSTAVETFTDTVTYTDTARILQVQRFEVGGEISDLRQPDTRSTLLRVRPGGVSASGLAGPPGSEAGDDGIVGLAIDATCA